MKPFKIFIIPSNIISFVLLSLTHPAFANFYLLISQCVPLNPSGQEHEYPLKTGLQVAPF